MAILLFYIFICSNGLFCKSIPSFYTFSKGVYVSLIQ